jgi:hypothetical protein
MVAAWEFNLNGVTFGGAQPVGLLRVDGLDSPGVRVDDISRPADHGSFIYANWLAARYITLEGDIVGSSEANFLTLMQNVQTIFTPAPQGAWMTFRSYASDPEKQIYVRTVRYVMPWEELYDSMYAHFTGQLVAADPRFYSTTLQDSGLLTANATNSFTLTNAGTIDTWPIVEYTGPGFTFKYENLTTGEFVTVAATLTAGQKLTLDFKNRTIFRADGTNFYNTLTNGSQWFGVHPGSNSMKVTVTSGSTSATKVQVTHRAAWY